MTREYPEQVPVGVCLQCGQAKASLEPGMGCETWGGYEYYEQIEEWPQHRWRGWTDADLSANGIKSDAFDRYCRASIDAFQWAPCDDTTRGHHPALRDDPEMGLRSGDCTLCGRRGVAAEQPVS